MANIVQTRYFSDLIGDTYKTWQNNRVILDGGTGTGKTTFIVDVLAKYAQSEGKKILYLCNRTRLLCQVIAAANKADVRDTVAISTYQHIESDLKEKKGKIGKFDYIVADECHYFSNDAAFNEYTDLSYYYIKEQQDSVVIYMSAKANIFFTWMRKHGVKNEHYFSIPKSYNYVEKLYFYDKNCLFTLVNNILKTEPESKIIIFCNSLERMKEIHEIYGNDAVYFASKNVKSKEVSSFISTSCLVERGNGLVTFDGRILVSTKVLDNGVDIKDPKIKHIFCEILDVDSAIQALGRKRSINEDDTCIFYLRDYEPQTIQGSINFIRHQLDPVTMYRENYQKFMKYYGYNRRRMRENQIFYPRFNEDNTSVLAYNRMRYKKYCMDGSMLLKMKETSYRVVMCELLGPELAGRSEVVDIYVAEKAMLLEHLKSIEGTYIYEDERKLLKEKIQSCGLKLRNGGIKTLNDALDDIFPDYEPRFRNKKLNEDGSLSSVSLKDKRRKLPDGTANSHRGKTYWILGGENAEPPFSLRLG